MHGRLAATLQRRPRRFPRRSRERDPQGFGIVEPLHPAGSGVGKSLLRHVKLVDGRSDGAAQGGVAIDRAIRSRVE